MCLAAQLGWQTMIRNFYRRVPDAIYRRTAGPPVRRWSPRDLIRATHNFRRLTWLVHPIWQIVLELWTMQVVIVRLKPDLLIECGTNRGGSSMFFAHLMDLMGHGRIVTVDVEKMHDLSHPRITYMLGSSVAK